MSLAEFSPEKPTEGPVMECYHSRSGDEYHYLVIERYFPDPRTEITLDEILAADDDIFVYFFDHPDDCPGHAAGEVGCAIEWTEMNDGLDGLLGVTLPIEGNEARFRVEFHHEIYSGGPWGPAEHDFWIQYVDPEVYASDCRSQPV